MTLRTTTDTSTAAPSVATRRAGSRVLTPLALLLAAVFALVLAGCGDDDGDASGEPAPGEEAAAAALDEERTVIDVRTPEEYAVGHVEDAELIDVQAADFTDRIAELDPDGEYVVYCRSGNRSAAATATMTDTGLDVLDGGGLGDMQSAGWPTTTG